MKEYNTDSVLDIETQEDILLRKQKKLTEKKKQQANKLEQIKKERFVVRNKKKTVKFCVYLKVKIFIWWIMIWQKMLSFS